MDQYILIIIGVLCGATLLNSFYKKSMESFINLVMRFVLGIVGIYVINTVLSYLNITNIVGLNALNVLVIGVLGIPGFLLLYGLGAYFMLI